jgi:hypothetical protein
VKVELVRPIWTNSVPACELPAAAFDCFINLNLGDMSAADPVKSHFRPGRRNSVPSQESFRFVSPRTSTVRQWSECRPQWAGGSEDIGEE